MIIRNNNKTRPTMDKTLLLSIRYILPSNGRPICMVSIAVLVEKWLQVLQNHDTLKRTASPAEAWQNEFQSHRNDSQIDCQFCRNIRLKNPRFPNNKILLSVLSMAAKAITVYLKPCTTGSSYRVRVTWAWSWHSPPSSAKVKNKRSYTSSPPLCPLGLHTGNFTFTWA